MSEQITLGGKRLELEAFVKFTGRKVTGGKGKKKHTIDHYVAGIRNHLDNDGSWTEFNDAVVTRHESLLHITENSFPDGRFVLALYVRPGYTTEVNVARGLRNIGNTCYMNAVLQLLLRDNDFVQQILPEIPSGSDSE